MHILSVVVPVFNECDILPQFVETVLPYLHEAGGGELILVNDGSRDESLSVMLVLSNDHPEVKVIDLSRNFGKEYAVTAGLQFATGDAVVVMDADLQHPPALIPVFMQKWREGFDVVFGVHDVREEASRLKKMLSRFFYKIFNRISDAPLPRNIGDFLLLDRVAVDAVSSLSERNRFMKGLFAWVGYRQVGVPYQQSQRPVGVSKWGFWKLWNFALDGLTSFSTLPLRLWSYLGLAVSLVAMLYALYLVLRTLTHGVDVPGFATLIVVILFLGGVQLISLGVIGEYLGRLYSEAKQRPLYLVRRTYGFDNQERLPRGVHEERNSMAARSRAVGAEDPRSSQDESDYGHDNNRK